MSVAIITGSAGLIGSEAARFFHNKGFDIVGVDNDMRARFFGPEASTDRQRGKIERELSRYAHSTIDIRDFDRMEALFGKYGGDIAAVIHAAAQPSHDWAAREPFTDFTVNANGTLNLLDLTRRHCPEAVFIFTSTNKVYGDTPNRLPLVEKETRWEVRSGHRYAEHGIDESMSIDTSTHSLFGASKVAADVLTQEYGRYFGMKTCVFRGGCLTGPAHSAAELHGFLAYLVLCTVHRKPYRVYGYKGKQVRDNIHAYDLVSAFWHFFQSPRQGEVYNMGGSRHSNISMMEAIDAVQALAGQELQYTVSDQARVGDHIWYVSDVRKFRCHFPEWAYTYTMDRMLAELVEAARGGW